jgi:hypothetical protein
LLRPKLSKNTHQTSTSGKFQMLLCALIYPKTGGADRDRTGDPRVANAVLSQLSYSPVIDVTVNGGSGRTRTTDLALIRGAL